MASLSLQMCQQQQHLISPILQQLAIKLQYWHLTQMILQQLLHNLRLLQMAERQMLMSLQETALVTAQQTLKLL